MHGVDSERMNLFNHVHALDCRVLQWTLGQRQRRLLMGVVRQVSRSGDGWLQVLVIACLLAYPDGRFHGAGIPLMLLFIIERALYWVLKNGLRRRRPPHVLPSFQALLHASDQFSFPSGHTSAAFLLAWSAAGLDPLLGTLAFAWAGAVGASRVMLGVHFPTDILAGAALGSAIAQIELTVFIAAASRIV